MWIEKNNRITKQFKFSDFKSALDFVNKVGDVADKANHHPDINLSWGLVEVSLTSHSEGKVTDKDLELSKKIDKINNS